jgi:LacI family transcriptional regulator
MPIMSLMPLKKRARTTSDITESSAPQRISLKEVAEAAGVSRMTVSLALRNHPTLPPATRARVQRMAEKLGYRPDPVIGSVMADIRARRSAHRQATIAYLTAHEDPDIWRNHPTQYQYYQGAVERAEAAGYHLEPFWLRAPGMTERRLSEVIRNRGINGVIVSPMPKNAQFFQDFRWDYFSAVAVGYSMETSALCRACNHQFQSMQLLVSELHRRGYQRIGFAMEEDQDNRVRHNWRGGFMSNPLFLPSWPNVPFLLHADWTRARFACWLEKEKPDVVITAGPEVGRWLKELGLQTPRDIGLANVDLSPAMQGITGINQNSPQVGTASVNLLISLMNSHERGVPAIPQILMVQGDFVQGSTTHAFRSNKTGLSPRAANRKPART